MIKQDASGNQHVTWPTSVGKILCNRGDERLTA
jgi:hypothetical protein